MASQAGYIYAIGAVGTSYVKIGSARNVEKRRKQLQTGQHLRLQTVASVSVERDLYAIERQVQTFLAEHLQGGEWFDTPMDVHRLTTLIANAVQWLEAERVRKVRETEERRRKAFEAAQSRKAVLSEEPLEHQTQLGIRIRRRRRDLDMTQAQLAELTGIPQFHISAIETGRISDIKTDTLWRLAKALQVTTDSLLERDETNEHEDMPALPELMEV